jgi:hypothetical protein
MMDWVERCIMILPDDMEGKDGFILAFKSFVDNYGESDNGISTQG